MPRKMKYGSMSITSQVRSRWPRNADGSPARGGRLIRGLRQLTRTDVEVRRALRHGVGQTVVVDGGHAAGHGGERRGGIGAMVDHLGRAGHQVVHAGADGLERLGQTIGEADLDAFHDRLSDFLLRGLGRGMDLKVAFNCVDPGADGAADGRRQRASAVITPGNDAVDDGLADRHALPPGAAGLFSNVRDKARDFTRRVVSAAAQLRDHALGCGLHAKHKVLIDLRHGPCR